MNLINKKALCFLALIAFGNGFVQAVSFEPLFKVTHVSGNVTLYKPGETSPIVVREAHAYPYGSRLVVPEYDELAKKHHLPVPSVSVKISGDHNFKISENSCVTILSDPSNTGKKIFDIAYGTIKTFITISTVKTGGTEDSKVEEGINALTFVTPVATLTRMTERNSISITKAPDGMYTAVFQTESGLMEIAGPQYKLWKMRKNTAVEIFGNKKDYTRITNLAGDFVGDIEKGVDPTSGEKVFESINFKIRHIVKIWRTYAKIGGKMAVSVMSIPPQGLLRTYAFLEGHSATTDSAYTVSSVANDSTDTANSTNATADTTTSNGETTEATTTTESSPTEEFGTFEFNF